MTGEFWSLSHFLFCQTKHYWLATGCSKLRSLSQQYCYLRELIRNADSESPQETYWIRRISRWRICTSKSETHSYSINKVLLINCKEDLNLVKITNWKIWYLSFTTLRKNDNIIFRERILLELSTHFTFFTMTQISFSSHLSHMFPPP